MWQNLFIELREDILLIFASSCIKRDQFDLMSSSKWAYSVISPLYYERLIISEDQSFENVSAALQLRPPSFFARHVKALLIYARAQPSDPIFWSFLFDTLSGLRFFEFYITGWNNPRSSQSAAIESITKLRFLKDFRMDWHFNIYRMDSISRHPLFDTVTHLTLAFCAGYNPSVELVRYFRAITHLTLVSPKRGTVEWTKDLVIAFLNDRPKLELLCILSTFPDLSSAVFDHLFQPKYPKVVVFDTPGLDSRAEHEKRINGRGDIWSRGQQILDERLVRTV
ncbi:hypothetical protein DL96DRAFT_1629581, partial [Flagelloscypha sp. PMI_526]